MVDQKIERDGCPGLSTGERETGTDAACNEAMGTLVGPPRSWPGLFFNACRFAFILRLLTRTFDTGGESISSHSSGTAHLVNPSALLRKINDLREFGNSPPVSNVV